MVARRISRGNGDQPAAERVPGGEDGIDAREGIEAAQLDLGLVGQALHRRRDVAELEIL